MAPTLLLFSKVGHSSENHASEGAFGQIYIPIINWALMAGCISLVIGFRSSGALASAYGVAVTSTMVTTTLLFYVVLRERFRWGRWTAIPLCALFMAVDVAYFGANLFKIPSGGWFPIVVAFAILRPTVGADRDPVARRHHLTRCSTCCLPSRGLPRSPSVRAILHLPRRHP